MSGAFELDKSGWDQRVADARLANIDVDQELDASAGEGIFSGTGQGIMRGGARTVDAAGVIAGGTLGRALDVAGAAGDTLDNLTFDDEGRQTSALAPIGTEHQDSIFGATDEIASDAVQFWTPSSRDVGAIGRTLGGFAEMVLPLASTGGNPVPLIATSGIEGSRDLVGQGVDATTAIATGEVNALATAVGFKLPFLGKTLAGKVATGGAGNVLLGGGATELQRELLTSRGYDDLAKNYDPLDVQSRAIDLLTGMAFGGIDWASVRSADRAVAAAANNAKHYQQDTAPGIPQDHEAIAVHAGAMDMAFAQLMRGEPVNVDPEVMRANYAPRPERDFSADEQAIREIIGDLPEPRVADTAPVKTPAESKLDRQPDLSESDRAIETRFNDAVEHNLDEMVGKYDKLKDTDGGKTINTDLARELSPDYLADRSKSAAVHEAASFLAKEVYRRRLAEAKPGGEVVFASGGAGSGKSSGLKLLGIKDQIVYDGTLSKFDGAVRTIEQALAAKQNARIIFTYRGAEAALKTALKRATDMEAQHGSGRTVPLKAFEQGHRGARDVFAKLLEKYGTDDRVRFDVIDNTGGPGEARRVKFDDLPQVDYNGLREKLNTHVKETRASGVISEAVARGFSGSREGQPGRPRSEGRGQPEPQRAEERADQLTERYSSPALEAVRQDLAERDVQVPTGEIDADGNAVVRSGREVLAQAEANIVKAQKDSVAFEAAVNCFLTRGEDAT